MNSPRRICPTHRLKMVHKDTRNGSLYACPQPGCTFMCWGKPTSRPGDSATRQLRRECHVIFDAIWQHKLPRLKSGYRERDTKQNRQRQQNSRQRLYSWLAQRMGIAERKTHFGMFNFKQCQHALSILESCRVITFSDGPAKGKLIAVTRTPFLLRIAVDMDTKECAALDDLKLRPRVRDKCYAYIMTNKVDDDEVDKSPVATYQLFEHQPPDAATFSVKEKWSAWCMDMANGPGRPIADKANISVEVDGKPIAG